MGFQASNSADRKQDDEIERANGGAAGDPVGTLARLARLGRLCTHGGELALVHAGALVVGVKPVAAAARAEQEKPRRSMRAAAENPNRVRG